MSDTKVELEYIQQAFDSNWIAPLGPNVIAFESEVCTIVGAGFSVALSSGTAAIHMALKAAGIKKEDIVLCQSFTFQRPPTPSFMWVQFLSLLILINLHGILI